MTNRPVAFTQADLARALKAAKAAEIPVAAYEISADGTIRVFAVGAIPAPKPGNADSWDDL